MRGVAAGGADGAAAALAAAASGFSQVATCWRTNAGTYLVRYWAPGATAGRVLELLREFREAYRRHYAALLAYAAGASAAARGRAAAEVDDALAAMARRARDFERFMEALEARPPDPSLPCRSTFRDCLALEAALRNAVNLAAAAARVAEAAARAIGGRPS